MRLPKETIEAGLRSAVRAQTPDVLPDVLRRIKQQEGLDKTMDSTNILPYPTEQAGPPRAARKKPLRILAWAASIAAVFILGIGIYLGAAFYRTDAIVCFDVNPSVELRLNSGRKVLSANALNADAQIILGGMDFQGVDLEVAVNALMGSMLKHGYITANQNTILISVESGSEAGRAALQQQLVQEVEGILSQTTVDAAVLGQSLADDEQLRALAQQYDISLGKAALIALLVNQDPLQDFAQLAALPVNDIYLLLSSKQASMEGIEASGQPAAGSYIGDAAAKAAALAHAGVAEADVLSLEIELDFDDGRMIYDVEFKTAGAKFEYEIDAASGSVLEYEQKAQQNGSGSAIPANLIEESEAKSIALAHAGEEAGDVNFVKFTWYEKSGVYLYDMVFLSANNKYSYEVNALTGEILASYRHAIGGSNSGSGQGQGQSSQAQGDYIGEAQAKAIALAHAGVAEDALRGYEIELDYENGRPVYEIEFKAGGMEYDYEIDALTGEVRDWEAERD